MVLGFVCVGSVDIVCFGEGIFGFGIHTDETGDGVSDLSFECYGDTIDSSGRDSSVRSRVLSGFDSVNIESGLYVFESGDSIGISGIGGESCQARESDGSEDHENRDNHDEFHEGEAEGREGRGERKERRETGDILFLISVEMLLCNDCTLSLRTERSGVWQSIRIQ